MPVTDLVQKAIQYAESTLAFPEGRCDEFVARCYGFAASGYNSASEHWDKTPAEYKHPGDLNPPPGAVCLYQGGSHGFGHAALSLGGRKVRSTDMDGVHVYAPGHVATVDLLAPERWGYGQHYVGWIDPFYEGHLVTRINPAPPAPKENPVHPRVIDVSSYQTIAKMDALPFVPDMVFVKTTEIFRAKDGTVKRYINPLLHDQVAWARKHGAEVGFYVFLNPASVAPIERQINFHARTLVGLYRPGDAHAVDWESAGMTSQEKDAGLNRLHVLYPEAQNGLYCNENFWRNVDKDSHFGDFLWLARPGQPGQYDVQAHVTFHQYGIAYGMDQDVYLGGDRAHLNAWLRQKVRLTQATVAPSPAPVAPAPAPAVPPAATSAEKALVLLKDARHLVSTGHPMRAEFKIDAAIHVLQNGK